MADPELQIREGGGHPDPEIGGGRSPKNFLRPFGPQFGLKITRKSILGVTRVGE